MDRMSVEQRCELPPSAQQASSSLTAGKVEHIVSNITKYHQLVLPEGNGFCIFVGCVGQLRRHSCRSTGHPWLGF